MIKSVIWDEPHRLIISAGDDKRIRWWDARQGGGSSGSFVSELEFPEGLLSVERSFGSDWLSVGSGKKAIFLDTDTREIIFQHALTYPVSSCSLAPRTRDRFVTGSANDGWVRVYDAISGEMKEENKGLYHQSLSLLHPHQKNYMLISRAELPPNIPTGHHGPVHSIAFSPDGELYASGSEDGKQPFLSPSQSASVFLTY
jgi:serine-threonine kinase receptor-associated protein